MHPIQRSLDSDATDYATYERLVDVRTLESYPVKFTAIGYLTVMAPSMEMLFLDSRNCYLLEIMFTSFIFLCSCQLVCKFADLRNRACWTSFHKAGFVCMACCRRVLSHMEANCSMKST